METTNNSAIPPKIIKRNEYGLIEGVNYVFDEEGSVNWRRLVRPEHTVVNKQMFERLKKPVPESIEGLEDKYLLLLLASSKELASIRGFTRVNHVVTSSNPDQVVSVCTIDWIPNYETENRAVSFSSIGDATPSKTNGFARNYLGAIAENRAFVRCVRNFLKINIVSQEEIGPVQDTVQEDTSISLLKDVMKKHEVSFDTIKTSLVKENFTGAELFTEINQIPKFKQFELIERIKRKYEK